MLKSQKIVPLNINYTDANIMNFVTRTIEQPARGDGECEGDDKIERECQKPECPVCEIDGVVYHPTEFIKSLSNECKNW